MQESFDIVIPTYGRPIEAVRVAETVAEQCEEDDRVLLVWQGDTQPNTDSERVSVIRSAPPNLPRARNRGVNAGSNPLILFLDDDVEPEHRLLCEHRRALSLPGVGLVAGFVDDSVAVHERTVPSFYDETTGELQQNFTLPDSGYAVSAKGANMSFRRSALMAAGGFDENYKGNALWEEIDCAFRLAASGHKVWYCASARVKHAQLPEGGCRAERGPGYVFRQFANTAYFAARFAEPRHCRSWFTFWKYRLEYISRRRILFLKHDPRIVLAAVLGACTGLFAHAVKGHRLDPARNRGNSPIGRTDSPAVHDSSRRRGRG